MEGNWGPIIVSWLTVGSLDIRSNATVLTVEPIIPETKTSFKAMYALSIVISQSAQFLSENFAVTRLRIWGCSMIGIMHHASIMMVTRGRSRNCNTRDRDFQLAFQIDRTCQPCAWTSNESLVTAPDELGRFLQSVLYSMGQRCLESGLGMPSCP